MYEIMIDRISDGRTVFTFSRSGIFLSLTVPEEHAISSEILFTRLILATLEELA